MIKRILKESILSYVIGLYHTNTQGNFQGRYPSYDTPILSGNGRYNILRAQFFSQLPENHLHNCFNATTIEDIGVYASNIAGVTQDIK